jgi:hypothetical protein
VDDFGRQRSYRQQKLTRQGFYERRKQRSRERRAANYSLGNIPAFEKVTRSENLLAAYYTLKANSGVSPGPDRVTYNQLGPREAAAARRDLAKELNERTYGPSKTRPVHIRKSRRRGYRILSLRSIRSRVGAKVLADALGPHFDRLFLDGSHGCRPSRDAWSLLVDLETTIRELERYIVAQDDIANAFNNVPMDYICDLYGQYIEGPRLLNNVNKIFGGHPAEGERLVSIKGVHCRHCV